jgi:UrcA family protein
MNTNVKTANRTALVLSTAVCLTCGWLGSTALADEPVRSETVKFRDLNVNTPEGVQALYGRIHAAAKRVCSDTDPVFRFAASSCARESEAQAVAKVGLPQLVAYYRVKTGDRAQPLIAGQ